MLTGVIFSSPISNNYMRDVSSDLFSISAVALRPTWLSVCPAFYSPLSLSPATWVSSYRFRDIILSDKYYLDLISTERLGRRHRCRSRLQPLMRLRQAPPFTIDSLMYLAPRFNFSANNDTAVQIKESACEAFHLRVEEWYTLFFA